MKENIFLSQLDFDVTEEEFKEAVASLNSNPVFVRPIKFIFTDAFANANKQRIPEKEFDNVIRTGVNMPIKIGPVDENNIPEGHEGAFPLGVITHLAKSGSTVKGLGLLWKEERPYAVQFIKDCYDKKIPVNLSWEIGYTDSAVDNDGVEDLLGVAVKATTVVGLPAYEGRTPILTVASKNPTEENVDKLEQEILELKDSVQKKDTLILEKDQKISELETKVTELETTNKELSEYKEVKESEIVRNQKISDIKNQFIKAGIEKDQAYFDEKIDKLLTFDNSELEFFLQELVSMGTASVQKKEDKKVEIPNVVDNKATKIDPKELGKKLREQEK